MKLFTFMLTVDCKSNEMFKHGNTGKTNVTAFVLFRNEIFPHPFDNPDFTTSYYDVLITKFACETCSNE